MDFSLYIFGLFCITAVSCNGISNADTEEACANNNPADIVFVLDESGSIWGPDFERQIDFVEDVCEVFDVTEGSTHIGLMTFGDTPRVHFNLGEVTELADIEAALEEVQQARGGTYTYDAIEKAYTEMFSSQHSRPGLPQICILITDGESENTEKTAAQAKLAREAGLTMFAIGVGMNINKQELLSIATEPAEEYTFTVESYGALDKLKNTLAWEVCQITTLPPPTTTTTTTTTTTHPPTTPPQMIPGCDGYLTADLLFSIPDQAGIDGTDHTVNFIDSIVAETELSPIQVQVGVSPRSCEQANAIILKKHDTKDGFSKDLSRRRHTSCRTDQHIYYMRTQGTTAKNGARDDSVKVGILIVDNASFNSRRTKREADRAKTTGGMQLITIGIGSRVDRKELETISSGPDSTFWVADYSQLDTIKDDVLHRLCGAIIADNQTKKDDLYQFLLRDLQRFKNNLN